MKNIPVLSIKDWRTIYYALHDKHRRLKRTIRDYDDSSTMLEWKNEIESIIAIIGLEGENMYPVKTDKDTY